MRYFSVPVFAFQRLLLTTSLVLWIDCCLYLDGAGASAVDAKVENLSISPPCESENPRWWIYESDEPLHARHIVIPKTYGEAKASPLWPRWEAAMKTQIDDLNSQGGDIEKFSTVALTAETPAPSYLALSVLRRYQVPIACFIVLQLLFETSP